MLSHRITGATDIATGATFNVEVATSLAKGWVSAELHGADVGLNAPAPREGQGVVGQRAGRPVAVSTVDGVTCAVSGMCTHLGGILNWNDAERSWDCPLHGSRFSSGGVLLEGPATTDLKAFDARATDGT